MNQLRRWIVPTNRNWMSFYNVAEKVLQHLAEDGVDYFHTISGCRRTYVKQNHEFLRSETGSSTECSLATSLRLNSTSMRYLSFGPHFVGRQWTWDCTENKRQDL